MRLQHGGGEALYRDLLQAATLGPVLFGFCKISDFVVRFTDLRAKLKNRPELRLADGVSAASGSATVAAVSSSKAGGYQSTQEKNCCSQDE